MDHQERGYQPVTLIALVNHWPSALLPDRPIVLTFDDGYRDFYDVLPILRDYGACGYPLVTAPIDDGSLTSLPGTKCEMHAAGIEMGRTHPPRSSGQLVDYLVADPGQQRGDRERIEEPVRFFAYPSGAYDDDTVRG